MFLKARVGSVQPQCCLVGLVLTLAQRRCQSPATSTVTRLLYFQTVKGYGSLPRHAAVSPSTFGSLNRLNPFKSSVSSLHCRSQTESQTCPRLLLHFARRPSSWRRDPNTRRATRRRSPLSISAAFISTTIRLPAASQQTGLTHVYQTFLSAVANRKKHGPVSRKYDGNKVQTVSLDFLKT